LLTIDYSTYNCRINHYVDAFICKKKLKRTNIKVKHEVRKVLYNRYILCSVVNNRTIINH